MITLTLPVWPSASDASFFAAAKAVFDEFRGYGLPAAGSFGMVAQAEAESAFKLDAVGDHDSAFGMWQHHGVRIAIIKEKIGIDIRAFPPLDEQCAAAWWELQTFPSLGLAELRAAATASEGGIAGCKFFERAGAKDALERRGAMGTRWSTYAAKNGWL